jgi:SAM-dependent methyltransferase
MQLNRLNFGCGTRFSKDWVNIDFHSESSEVQRVNLLSGFPFAEASFDVVYSSHVLEHFDRTQVRFLLNESWRVMKTGGILRVVVPDLQRSCAEYLRILDLPNNETKEKLYSWIIIELCDQMVRNVPGGEMGPFIRKVAKGDDKELQEYIQTRTHAVTCEVQSSKRSIFSSVRGATKQKIFSKIPYFYLKFISLLLPASLRTMVFVQTSIGEKHRWMYDSYGLSLLLSEAGFSEISQRAFNQSQITDFNTFHLDCTFDGGAYKPDSLYLECIK